MRYQEIKLDEDTLLEVNMSPSRLRQAMKDIPATCGMEFELYVPNASGGDSGEMEEDWSRRSGVRNMDASDAAEWFNDGDYNGSRGVAQLQEKIEEEYNEFVFEQGYEAFSKQAGELVAEYMKEVNEYETEEAFEEAFENEMNNEGIDFQSAQETFIEEFNDGYYWRDFWEHKSISDTEDVYREYCHGNFTIHWPYYENTDNTESGETSMNDVGEDFEAAIGRKVVVGGDYHQMSGSTRSNLSNSKTYILELDGSLDKPNSDYDKGMEFVSPKLSLPEMMDDLEKIKTWASRYGCYTNSSTGLHMNISVDSYDNKNVDYVKLAILLGDEHVLREFDRESNTYCKSAFKMIQNAIKTDQNIIKNAKDLLDKMRAGMNSIASKVIHSGSTQKYTSINNKYGYIEFRSPGDDWLTDLSENSKIQNTLMRCIVALDAACDPEKYKQEYHKKLYKLLDPTRESTGDVTNLFADYVAGKTPKAALKSFVRQMQAVRASTRATKDSDQVNQKYRWKITLGSNPDYSMEVVAMDENEAKARAKASDPLTLNRYLPNDIIATKVAAYDDSAARDAEHPYGQTKTYIIYKVDNANVELERFTAASRDDARLLFRQWCVDNIVGPAGYGFKISDDNEQPWSSSNNSDAKRSDTAPTTLIPGSTLDLQNRRAAAARASHDAHQASLNPQAAANQPQDWYVFHADRPSQVMTTLNNLEGIDAYRAAHEWARDNGVGTGDIPAIRVRPV